MKKLLLSATLVLGAAQVHAGWFDWFGGDDDAKESEKAEQKAAPATQPASSAVAASMGLIPGLTDSLGVSETQAQGGVGSLLQVAQGTLSGDEFATLSGYLPDADTLLKAAPALGGSDSALGSALATAGQYSQTAKMAAQVASQFEALGLDPALAAKYIVQIQSFLQSSGGKAAVDLFTKGVASLV